MNTMPVTIAAAQPDDAHPMDLAAVERLTDALHAEWLDQQAILPVRLDDGTLIVAAGREHVDVQAIDDLMLLFNARVELVRTDEANVRAAIQRVYADEATAQSVIAGMTDVAAAYDDTDIPLDDLLHLANEAPVVKLVNLLLLEALDARASDVHLEGYTGRLRVRYRLDGVLQDAPAPPAHLSAAIVSRLKIMAELDIAERRVPQDGRIRLRLRDRQVDVRVSTLPTLHGESIVLRLLDKQQGRIALHEIGMADDTLEQFSEVIQRPHGIVLATGPTGSGKTTTLYAAVDRIRTGREKILTVEDPVEYELTGVPQTPVNEKAGVTFASALRALLRQDPDVLLVGEIRDEQTAEIATHAALTGHLVLSTLHTNDAAGALTRLTDLGVAPYLVASTVEAVIAQRLVRTLCTQCREILPDDRWRESLGGPAAHVETAWHGAGCTACSGTGYYGRTGIYELIVMSDEIRAALPRRRSSAELRTIARAARMRSLRDDGIRLIAAGVTAPGEVLRVTRA